MGFTKFGLMLHIGILIGTLLISMVLLPIQPIVSGIIWVLYAAWIVFNIVVHVKCVKLIKENNEAVESYAKANDLEIKKISPEKLNELNKKGICESGDLIINKEGVKYI